jgi:hypothetical protein
LSPLAGVVMVIVRLFNVPPAPLLVECLRLI